MSSKPVHKVRSKPIICSFLFDRKKIQLNRQKMFLFKMFISQQWFSCNCPTETEPMIWVVIWISLIFFFCYTAVFVTTQTIQYIVAAAERCAILSDDLQIIYSVTFRGMCVCVYASTAHELSIVFILLSPKCDLLNDNILVFRTQLYWPLMRV